VDAITVHKLGTNSRIQLARVLSNSNGGARRPLAGHGECPIFGKFLPLTVKRK
jgi:hypothetical protein